jgi:hypothetical protein
MFLEIYKVKARYTRKSKTGIEHEYFRMKQFVKLVCDCCQGQFTRPKGNMDPKRLNNNYFHVCDRCDSKRFAQKKGVEQKQKWNYSASSSTPINKL